MAINLCEPAFPTTDQDFTQGFGGMTLRDWFAGQSLASMSRVTALLASQADLAEAAYKLADAMLAERHKNDVKPPDDQGLMLWALTLGGWKVRERSLFDEEGIEGWEWTDPKGHEHCVIGDWKEPPPIDDDIRQMMAKQRCK